MKKLIVIGCLLLAAARSEAYVEPVSRDSFRINTPDAEICGSARSREIALQTAAVEVIRQGAGRFVSEAEDQDTSLAGIWLTRDIDDNPIGVNLDTRTQQVMLVRILRRGAPGYANGLSARTVLGPDWRSIAAEGASTSCF